MTELDFATSRQICDQLIAYLSGKLPLTHFDHWLSNTPEMQLLLSKADYTTLMTINLQQADAPTLVNQLLRGYIDWGQYEKEQMADLLMAIIWKDDLLTALTTAHEQYKLGLRFLNVLGNEYGSAVIAAGKNAAASPTNQETVLEKVYPKAAAEAKRLLNRLVADRIQFMGTYSTNGVPNYVEK